MIPRIQEFPWGSHRVFAKSMTAYIDVDPATSEISFRGHFQTNKVLFDLDNNVIASENGPIVELSSLDLTDSVTLSDGTELSVAQVVETITEFYKAAYENTLANSIEP